MKTRMSIFQIIGIALMTLTTTVHSVDAAMSDKEIISKLEAKYTIEVLKVFESPDLDSNLLAIRVLNTIENSNNTLEIYTIFVNKEIGEPVPLYGEIVSHLKRTSPLIYQRGTPRTVFDVDQ